MQLIGDILKQAREKRGMSLQEIFDATRITVQNLSALEENRFDFFPNKVYARAFLRDYSNFLSLDSSDLLTRYEDEWKQEAQQVPEPKAEAKGCRSSLPIILVVVIVLAVAVGAYFLWNAYNAERQFPGHESFRVQPTPYEPMPTPTPAVTPAPSPTPGPEVSPSVTPRATEPSAAPSAGATPVPPSPSPGAAAVTPTPSPAAKPTPTPAAKPTPAPVKGVELTLKARSEVWVRVVADGKRLYEATVPASKTMTWRGDKEVTVRIAKPGDVTLTVNGKPVKFIGNPVIPVNRTFRPEKPQP